MTPASLSTTARRIADQLDVASELLRQEPVTQADLERVYRVVQAESDLLRMVLGRARTAQERFC